MNLLILVYLLLIGPKLLFDRLVKNKKHPGFLQRLGFQIPISDKPVIWLHAVSVGEVKSAQPLFRALRAKYKDAFFLITTVSATGQDEAKRSLLECDAFAYLPIDLSWIVRRWVAKLNPRQFILIEGDFWPNLLSALKKNKTPISLVSGKISERSALRFQRFSFFSKKLFAHFDLIGVQNEEHRRRFLRFVPDPSRLHVTGNLKLDIQPQPIDTSLWIAKLGLKEPVITISCTHAPEEELLLDALSNMEGSLILAPRHPERFEEVAQLLAKKNISFFRWSALEKKRGGERVLLIDAMGELPVCYCLSRLAIVAGSYVDHVGGHNVLEPCLYGTPVIFGPYVRSQTEFAARALHAGGGMQVSLKQLRGAVEVFFSDPIQEKRMRSSALELIESSRGSTIHTLSLLPPWDRE